MNKHSTIDNELYLRVCNNGDPTRHLGVTVSESETNRTFPVRVRFGSTEFLKCRFGSSRQNWS